VICGGNQYKSNSMREVNYIHMRQTMSCFANGVKAEVFVASAGVWTLGDSSCDLFCASANIKPT
jgi:hypothetical protein